MTSPMLRPIATSDLERIAEINAANVPEVGAVDRDRLSFLVAESAIALTADVDGLVVGFCLVLPPGSSYDSVNYRWFAERYPTAMYLDRVAFDESVRGQGLGTAMYAEVARTMADRWPAADALTLEVNVNPPNEPSLRFHRKLGFEEVGRQTAHGIEVSLMHRPTTSAG
jgi:predicted GNAT superfamily acetyltransferase